MGDFRDSIKVDNIDSNKAIASSKEKLNSEVLKLIEFIKTEIKRIDPDLEPVDIFLNGNCGDLASILSEEFPDLAQPYVIRYKKRDPYHIVTKIGDKFYDITGETDISKYNKYLNTHNRRSFEEKDFEILKAGLYDVMIQSGKYIYNEYLERSEIKDQMKELREAIRNREKNK